MFDAGPQQKPIAQELPVYRADDLRVVHGANEGDALSFATDLTLDDSYALRQAARQSSLALTPDTNGHFRIAPTSSVGTAFAGLYLDCCLTLMRTCGDTVEALVFVEVSDAGSVAAIYVHGFSDFSPKEEYRLVGIDRENAHRRLALTHCMSFTRGTHITMADGTQRPIDTLRAGDMVLTRDAGAQPIRWIGRSTQRASGPFAPVVIAKGVLNNLRPLILHPNHRLFVYQRQDHIEAGRAEVMVTARHLLNGQDVHVQNGGFVDYFQLLLDDHQFVYAEGIAAETMQVTQRTEPVLPKGLVARFSQSQPGLTTVPAAQSDRALLQRRNAAAVLRRAASGEAHLPLRH
ncbi:Hint domain-containing protein [Cognatishimia maritima]|uniref:Hint domain-containing protein n=1 Tax=Cognatishimia maritima TaxID=870908 RepID=A0A1M5W646_9RHOB|nr:Hint domain-containing protein [Cognatishimia maritima]SHH83069.1 Hint domain-containing protein [Cognatishimia maritima]